jgi:hypothetical protein
VFQRDGYACLSCGWPGSQVINHRLSGMGGRRPQTPEWLTLACQTCNMRYEDEPLWAYAGGWKIRSGHDATVWPVYDAAGSAWLLDVVGGRSLIELEAS